MIVCTLFWIAAIIAIALGVIVATYTPPVKPKPPVYLPPYTCLIREGVPKCPVMDNKCFSSNDGSTVLDDCVVVTNMPYVIKQGQRYLR